jgi:hypothetical protein
MVLVPDVGCRLEEKPQWLIEQDKNADDETNAEHDVVSLEESQREPFPCLCAGGHSPACQRNMAATAACGVFDGNAAGVRPILSAGMQTRKPSTVT